MRSDAAAAEAPAVGAAPAGRPTIVLTGLAASPGIAIGPVHVHAPVDITVPDRDLAPEAVEPEVEHFRQAIDRAREQVVFLRARVAEDASEEEARIFDAQLLFLEDFLVIEPVLAAIRSQRKSAAYVFRHHVVNMLESLENADSEFQRQRADVFRDIKRRVLRLLLELDDERPSVPPRCVLAGRDLAPSDVALVLRTGAAGFATEYGGMTSHAAIMARSKGVPAVVGVRGLMRHARPGDVAVVDGLAGGVVLNPDPDLLASYERRLAEYLAFEGSLVHLRDEPAVTTDGRLIELGANLETPADIEQVLAHGADSIGLYRTEFFYIDRARMPGEEEQFAAYREVAERMHPRPVIIRTMDLGGDKVASYLGADRADRESNPFLGWRGIRFSLEHREPFRAQLRAIYRASRYGRVKLMLPMIATVEELRAARALAAEVLAEIDRARIPRGDKVEFGIMVETPSAVLIADILAREVDFFSVGTNDLIQYTLAADRSNPKTAGLYQPLHPAILRSLRIVVDAARAQRIWVGICGEMAADPLAAALLVGLGFDELSVSPFLVPEVKAVVRSIAYAEARAVVEEAVRLDSAAAVRALVLSRLAGLLPQFLLP